MAAVVDLTVTTAGSLRVVDRNTAVGGTTERRGSCSAVVPEGWSLQAGPAGDTADVTGARGRAHAAWGIRGVNPAMRAVYGDLFGPPDVAALATIGAATHAQARFIGAPQSSGAFSVRRWQAGQSAGTAVYRSYPAPLAGQYILSVYLAWADGGAATLLPAAEAVMASIDCRTQLKPPPLMTTADRPRPGAAAKKSSRGDLADYNAQLGTQWAHSPSTGRHYLLDNATQWNANGPDGPGYYAKSGNSYEKLEVGW